MAPVWALVEQLGRMGVKARLPPAPCKKKRQIGLRGFGHGLLHKGAVLEKVYGGLNFPTKTGWFIGIFLVVFFCNPNITG